MALSSPPAITTSNFRNAFATWLDTVVVAVNNNIIVANEAALVSGTVTGQTAVCSESGNRYTWDGTKWRVGFGNSYATASLPTTAYTIITACQVIDTTTNTIKSWNGSAWA